MSYILDALKKSDQERNRGAAPGLQTVHATPQPASSRRPWWIGLLLFALLLNAGLILYWLRPWSAATPDLRAARQEKAGENRKETLAKVIPADENGVPAAAVSKPHVTPQSSPGTAMETHSPRVEPDRTDIAPAAERRDPRPAQSKVAKKPVTAKTVDAPMPTQPAKPLEQAKSAHAPSTEKRAAGNAMSVEKLAELNSQMIEKALMIRDGTAERGSAQPKAAPALEKPQVPGLKDLPRAIQKEMPKLELSFLVFSQQPKDRMVSINGQMTREGQEVAPGLKLEEITPDGAIFSYKEHRFKKGVF
ncbi:general secretion pathway protein GspB [Desulfoferrobacter suflitae]|uniref:general secretion pathway protein GspB n=1 Tax=Desulfoferrobacter suflitae TaxID=2865782 RepID=UPI0021643E0C|nr:general secretion pathway protein GspB [Desulfoferrobacter suflitae]MCK8603565.1 general secretion pathway protein GspB [Desulfoferrobacter suflitae]